MVELLHINCMDYMVGLPDKAFDLAIVDPPYGIGFDGETESMVTNNASGKWKGARGNGYKRKKWDDRPEDEYFFELMRVADRLIIWGGNYFTNILPPSGGWIVWDKKRPEDFSLSQAELAWCSFGGRVSIFKYLWNGFQKEIPESRFHPTQKPVKLYKWLLQKYAKECDKILDTHLGSGSSAIAAHQMGFEFVGCEIDKDYYTAACKRFKEQTMQQQLFK